MPSGSAAAKRGYFDNQLAAVLLDIELLYPFL